MPPESDESIKIYNAALFNEWGKAEGFYHSPDDKSKRKMYGVHKSWNWSDGCKCLGGKSFIVAAMLPTGLILNCYKAKDWDLFKVPELEKCLFEFDGHTQTDALERIKKFINRI